MSLSIAALREMTDADLIREHDLIAPNTFIGTAYYQEELKRRSRERLAVSSELLARRVFGLSVVSLIAAALALVAAVLIPLLTTKQGS